MIKFLDLLNESRRTEELGINLLRKNGIEDSEKIVKIFIEGDESDNQKNVPFMSLIYLDYKDIDQIITVFNEFNELEKKRRIKPIGFSKGSLFIGDKKIDGFIDFANIVHATQAKYSDKTPDGPITMDDEDLEAMDTPMWSGNGFDIYDANSAEKCIKYRNGGLTGKSYSFCIGAYGSQNLYQSYRDKNDSTFYFIVDKNRIVTNENGSVDLSDPLHLVVFDRERDGIVLTDANNSTGYISEFGGGSAGVRGYLDYLGSYNVPVEMLVNRPKTEKEKEEDNLLKYKNDDLQWFINLPMDLKSKYIGRGHPLTDKQFDYLIGDKN